jgi:phosphopantetheine adenylyltransferase
MVAMNQRLNTEIETVFHGRSAPSGDFIKLVKEIAILGGDISFHHPRRSPGSRQSL